MRKLSLAELKLHGASFATLIVVASASPLWTEEQIEKYKHVYAKQHPQVRMFVHVANGVIEAFMWTTLVLYWLVCVVPAKFCEYVFGLDTSRVYQFQNYLFHTFKNSKLELDDWQTNGLYDGSLYMRDNVSHKVPDFVATRVKAIQGILPEAEFYVSFYGTDPILEVHIYDGSKPQIFYPLVWDEVGGKAFIIDPPH